MSTTKKRVSRTTKQDPAAKTRVPRATPVLLDEHSNSTSTADDSVDTLQLEGRETTANEADRASAPTRHLDEMFRVSEVLGGGVEGFQKAYRQMHELAPRDPLEGLLVAQMANVHNMSMRLCASGMRREQAPEAADFYFQQAARLMRVFASILTGQAVTST